MSRSEGAPVVLVTRPEPGATDLANALRAQGLEPLILPTITAVVNTDTSELDRAIADLDSYDWVVFASGTAVRILLARMDSLGVPVDRLSAPRLLCGPSTALALREAGLAPTILEPRFSATGAAHFLSQLGVRGLRVLLPQAENGRKELAESLAAAGALVNEVELYSTVTDFTQGAAILDLLRSGRVDAITFASPSAVRGIVEAIERAGEPNAAQMVSRVPIFCIGSTTRDEAVRLGFDVRGVAGGTSAESLAAVVARWFTQVGAGR